MLDRLQFYADIVKNSPLYNKEFYLCSCFAIDDDWQVDFYSKKAKSITSFIVIKKEAKIIGENQKIFQKENVELEELKLKKVAVDLDEAIEIVENLKKEMCPAEQVNKTIKILQKIKVPIWNITYLTNSFKILNAKINALTGEVLQKTLQPAFGFAQTPEVQTPEENKENKENKNIAKEK